MDKALDCLTSAKIGNGSSVTAPDVANPRPTIGFSDGSVFEITPHLERSFELRCGCAGGAGCWNWQGARNGDGYGLVSGQGIGRLVRAHRLSYAIEHGHLEPDAMVLHTCDNRLCVNPAHLYVGDAARNSLDMIERGRSRLGRCPAKEHP